MMLASRVEFTSGSTLISIQARVLIAKFHTRRRADRRVVADLHAYSPSPGRPSAPRVLVCPVVTLLGGPASDIASLAAIDEVRRRRPVRVQGGTGIGSRVLQFFCLDRHRHARCGLRPRPPYRRQTALIIAGAIVPWAATCSTCPGAAGRTRSHAHRVHVSGACLTWGIYRMAFSACARGARDGRGQHGGRRDRARSQRRIVDSTPRRALWDARSGRPIDEASGGRRRGLAVPPGIRHRQGGTGPALLRSEGVAVGDSNDAF